MALQARETTEKGLSLKVLARQGVIIPSYLHEIKQAHAEDVGATIAQLAVREQSVTGHN